MISDQDGAARRGRPKTEQARDRVITLRVNDDEFQRLKEAARVNSQELSDFIRDAVNEAASECMEGPSIFRD